MLTRHAGALIGDQALDFHKQDGVTEIEESLEANVVERALNDQLLEAEQRGEVRLNRAVALVGCVSNFGNFLDLCRKTLRNLEAGIPVLVLSRSNTTQHNFRWVQLLLNEMREAKIDAGMVTYLSATVEEQRRVMAALAADSPYYLTGSRPVAEAIKGLMPKTFSSTGGPNTMVAPALSDEVKAAAQMSTAIENSGQCTAMRHLVTDAATADDVEAIFSDLKVVPTPRDALAQGAFDAVFPGWAASFAVAPGYAAISGKPAAFKLGNAGAFPAPGIDENWRRLYLDVTTPAAGGSVREPAFLSQLARWLTAEQPITLAVNGDEGDDFKMSKQLFKETAQVVYSVGRGDAAALTCQARPQDGEIFGEFPPRSELTRYSAFPVFVPSATPGYVAGYAPEYLAGAATGATGFGPKLTAALLTIADEGLRGYAVVLLRYLQESCGAKEGIGARTTLWGLQRPPVWEGTHTLLRVNAGDGFDTAALQILPFAVTNARAGLAVSVADGHADAGRLAEFCANLGVDCAVEESAEAFDAAAAEAQPWNVVAADNAAATAEELPLVSHYVSIFFPMGHIKSVLSGDRAFVDAFQGSEKWLRFEG
mmetsp:Transcript_37234/g.116393  ORF Transcript_37234/g.116393 Transcript_37234/m.116393 type:complete len:595 (-) Transcript_37234:100-1884(-)